jgi:glycosyltransferase involved in cell wall biosynthesis
MSDIAVCIPVFLRTEKVSTLLDSINRTAIEKVYIADDGEMTEEKTELYATDFEFELEVFDLEYDAGVGKKRNVLAAEPDEEYLLFLDSDMEIPTNYHVLHEQLEARPEVGFVAGTYLEPDRIYTVASDIYIEDDVLYRDIRTNKQIETVAGAPFVEFDFLPQVGLLRRECAEDYNWDSEYTIMREHIDFFVGHWKHTDWKMAVSPSVFFPHYPGGDTEYLSHRKSDAKHDSSDEYFRDKWGVKEFKIANGSWIQTYRPENSEGKIERLADIYRNEGAVAAARSVFRYVTPTGSD